MHPCFPSATFRRQHMENRGPHDRPSEGVFHVCVVVVESFLSLSGFSQNGAFVFHFLHPILGLRLLDGLERELPGRVQLEQLLKQLGDVGALLGRSLDVLALPHLLENEQGFVNEATQLAAYITQDLRICFSAF